MEEIWRPIPVEGFRNYYSVSSHGRVRSEPRVIIRKNGTPNRVSVRILRPSISGCGYLSVILNGENSSRRFNLHRLVAMAFLLRIHAEKNEVNHLNGDKSDNCITNLEWCSSAENKAHAKSAGLSSRGVSNNFINPGGHKYIYVAEDAASGEVKQYSGIKSLSDSGFHFSGVRRSIRSGEPYLGKVFTQIPNLCDDRSAAIQASRKAAALKGADSTRRKMRAKEVADG